MQKKFLYLTIGAVLIAPSLAVAAHNEITPADMRTTPAPTTLQSKVEGPSGELLATQPGEVEINQSDESMPSRVDTTSVNRGNITPADFAGKEVACYDNAATVDGCYSEVELEVPSPAEALEGIEGISK